GRGTNRNQVAKGALQHQIHRIAGRGGRRANTTRAEAITAGAVRSTIQSGIIRKIDADFGRERTRKGGDSFERSSRGYACAVVACGAIEVRVVGVLTANARFIIGGGAVAVAVESSIIRPVAKPSAGRLCSNGRDRD